MDSVAAPAAARRRGWPGPALAAGVVAAVVLLVRSGTSRWTTGGPSTSRPGGWATSTSTAWTTSPGNDLSLSHEGTRVYGHVVVRDTRGEHDLARCLATGLTYDDTIVPSPRSRAGVA